MQILGSGERTLPARVQTRVFEFLTGGGCETLKGVCRALRDQLREFIELRYASTYDREGFNSSGFHRLHVLAAKGDVDGLEELFATRSDLDVDVRSRAVACRGATPLMRAALWNRISCVKLLLERKANLSLVDSQRETALDIASRMGNEEIASLLQFATTAAPPSAPPAPRVDINANAASASAAISVSGSADDKAEH